MSDIRLEELSADYETEHADLERKLEQRQTELTGQEQHTEDVERFICECRQYTDLTELTPTILNDLVSKVFVESPDKSDGKRRQNIHISYDLAGILPELNTPIHGEKERCYFATPPSGLRSCWAIRSCFLQLPLFHITAWS